MTSGIRKRSFESWVHRRQINLDEWLKNKQITSLSHLKKWCNENNLVPPKSSDISSLFVDASIAEKEYTAPDKPVPSLSSEEVKSKQAEKISSKKEAWHTPAAERPRRAKKKKRVTNDSKKR